jgi:hypothetical protein
MNTSVNATIIKEISTAILNSMKFLWRILWASVVPNGLPLYMTLYYIYVGLILVCNQWNLSWEQRKTALSVSF